MLPFTSTLANAIAIGALLVSIAGGAWAVKVHYDKGIIAEVAARQAAAVAQAQLEADRRTIEGLQAANAAATARIAKLTQLEATINATPRTVVCQSTPAFRALVLGMRHAGSGARQTPAATGPGVGVPAAASAAR